MINQEYKYATQVSAIREFIVSSVFWGYLFMNNFYEMVEIEVRVLYLSYDYTIDIQ